MLIMNYHVKRSHFSFVDKIVSNLFFFLFCHIKLGLEALCQLILLGHGLFFFLVEEIDHRLIRLQATIGII